MSQFLTILTQAKILTIKTKRKQKSSVNEEFFPRFKSYRPRVKELRESQNKIEDNTKNGTSKIVKKFAFRLVTLFMVFYILYLENGQNFVPDDRSIY